jgi:hypothetical protein
MIMDLQTAIKNDKFNPNLRINDRVRIVNSGDPSLEGRTGTLAGVVSLHLMVCWIVELDEKWHNSAFEVKCVSIPSMCLEICG